MRSNASSLLFLLSIPATFNSFVAVANELRQPGSNGEDYVSIATDESPIGFLRGLKNKNNKNNKNKNKNKNYNQYSSYNNGGYNNYNNNNGGYNNNNGNNSYNSNSYNSNSNNSYNSNSYNPNQSYSTYLSNDDATNGNSYNSNYSAVGATPQSSSSYNDQGSGSKKWKSGAKYAVGGLALLGLGYAGVKMNNDEENDNRSKEDENGFGKYFNMGAFTGKTKKSAKKSKSRQIKTGADSTFSGSNDSMMSEDESKALGSVVEKYQMEINKLQDQLKRERKKSARSMRSASTSRSQSKTRPLVDNGQLTHEDLAALNNEKMLLRQMLGAYENEFFRIYNRPIQTSEDTQPAAEQYRRYKEIKKITSPYAMVQQQQQQQGMGTVNGGDFGFSSSRWENFQQVNP